MQNEIPYNNSGKYLPDTWFSWYWMDSSSRQLTTDCRLVSRLLTSVNSSLLLHCLPPVNIKHIIQCYTIVKLHSLNRRYCKRHKKRKMINRCNTHILHKLFQATIVVIKCLNAAIIISTMASIMLLCLHSTKSCHGRCGVKYYTLNDPDSTKLVLVLQLLSNNWRTKTALYNRFC